MDNAGYPCSKSFRVTKVATDGHRVTMNPKSGTDLYSAIIDPGNIFHSRSSVQGYLTSRLHGTLTHRAENGIRRWIGNCKSLVANDLPDTRYLLHYAQQCGLN